MPFGGHRSKGKRRWHGGGGAEEPETKLIRRLWCEDDRDCDGGRRERLQVRQKDSCF
ncbi:hypothetical protein HanRHA438_Chr05g0213901 [Helianthus annuus]|nr:hypothetical protein HanRHA438_Chr05g0213901 [Helianthus annuus]